MVRVKSTPRKVEQHQTAAGVEARIKVSTSVTPNQIAHTEGQAAPGQKQQQKEQGQDDAVSGDSGDEDSMDISLDEFLHSDFKAADIHFEQFHSELAKYAVILEEISSQDYELRMKCFIERKTRKKNGKVKVLHRFHIYEFTLEDKWNEISEKILSQFRVVHDKSGNVQSYQCKRCLARVAPNRRALCAHTTMRCMKKLQNFRPTMYEDYHRVQDRDSPIWINICKKCGKAVTRNYHRWALHMACCGGQMTLDNLLETNYDEYIRRQHRRVFGGGTE